MLLNISILIVIEAHYHFFRSLNMECIFSQFPLKQKCLLRWAQRLSYPVAATSYMITPMPLLGKKMERGKSS